MKFKLNIIQSMKSKIQGNCTMHLFSPSLSQALSKISKIFQRKNNKKVTLNGLLEF